MICMLNYESFESTTAVVNQKYIFENGKFYLYAKKLEAVSARIYWGKGT